MKEQETSWWFGPGFDIERRKIAGLGCSGGWRGGVEVIWQSSWLQSKIVCYQLFTSSGAAGVVAVGGDLYFCFLILLAVAANVYKKF